MKKGVLAALIVISVLLSAAVFAGNALIVTEHPDAVYFALGKHYFNNHDYENSIKYFSKAVEFRNDFYEAQYNLGVAYYKSGNIQQAIESIKKSIELKNDYAKAYYSLGLAYFDANDYSNAIQNLKKASELENDNPNMRFDLAVAYVERFRQKESQNALTTDDLQDLREGYNNYLEAENIQSNFPNAVSNAMIVKDVLESYESNYN